MSIAPHYSHIYVCYFIYCLGAISRVGTAYPSGAPEFTPVFVLVVRVFESLALCVVFYRSLFVLLSFFFFVFCSCVIVLSVLRFTISDYPLGIFKLFFLALNMHDKFAT